MIMPFLQVSPILAAIVPVHELLSSPHLHPSLQPALTSYLSSPQLHFSGNFRTDCNKKNDDPCNYAKSGAFFRGSNNFEFSDAYVTSVVYADGRETQSDPIVGQQVVSYPRAKLTDLDVDCQNASTIYGLWALN